MTPLMALSQVAAGVFFAGMWQGLVLIAAVTLALRCLPRLGAAARFGIWASVFAGAMVAPLLGSWTRPAAAPGIAARTLHLGLGWTVAIGVCWAAASAARLLQLLVQAIQLRRVWLAAIPVAPNTDMVAVLSRSGRHPELCTSSHVDAPCVIGFFSPRLLLPEWLMERVTATEMRHIVLHECEHLRRRDDWLNLLQKLALIAFPLNPALMWADRRLGLEREQACDAGVVAATAAPLAYATCLTRLAEERAWRRNATLALSAWSKESELGRRVSGLLRPVATMTPVAVRVCVALLCLGVAGGGWELARVPQPISFAITASEAVPVVVYRPEEARASMVEARFDSTPRARGRGPEVPPPLQSSPIKPSRLVLPVGRAVMTLPVAKRPQDLRATEPEADRDGEGAVPVRFSTTYAAVRFADGWLVFQL